MRPQVEKLPPPSTCTTAGAEPVSLPVGPTPATTRSGRELRDLFGRDTPVDEHLLQTLDRGVALAQLRLELRTIFEGALLKRQVGRRALVALRAACGCWSRTGTCSRCPFLSRGGHDDAAVESGQLFG